MAVRTRKWVQALGPIVPPEAAAALKSAANARRLEQAEAAAERASADAARAEAKADQALAVANSAAAAGPSTVNNIDNSTTNNINITHVHVDSPAAKRARLAGDLRGYFALKS